MEDKHCGRSLWERFLEHFGFITDKTIYYQLRRIMETVQDVKAELEQSNAILSEIGPIVANVGGDVDSLLSQISALQEEILNGKVATQEDINELFATGKSIKDSLTSMKDALNAVDAKEPAQP